MIQTKVFTNVHLLTFEDELNTFFQNPDYEYVDLKLEEHIVQNNHRLVAILIYRKNN